MNTTIYPISDAGISDLKLMLIVRIEIVIPENESPYLKVNYSDSLFMPPNELSKYSYNVKSKIIK